MSTTPSTVSGLSVTVESGVTVIALGADFQSVDEVHLDQIRDRILAVTEGSPVPRAVVIDLSHTRFFGSSFIEVLFRTWNRVNDNGGKFALCGLSGYCLEILAVTHLDTLWKNYPTQSAALAALKG